MIECKSVPIQYVHTNDFDVFDSTPFIERRYAQLLEDGFNIEPLQARKIKTHDNNQHFKLLDANYKLRIMKKLGFKEAIILIHPVMSDEMAAQHTMRLANNTEIVNRNKVEVGIQEIKRKYSESEINEKFGFEELIPIREQFDIPVFELSEFQISEFGLDRHIQFEFDNLVCPLCGGHMEE